MKIRLLIIILFNSTLSYSQFKNIEISAGLGISGVNALFKNDIEPGNKVLNNIKYNTLDNKFKNVPSHCGYIGVATPIIPNLISGVKANLTFIEYNFKEVYFKEEEFLFGDGGDTINTPNWLIPSNSIPYLEFGISKEINFNQNFIIEISAYYGIALKIPFIHYSSSINLWDQQYSKWGISKNKFYGSTTNDEFDKINYGVRASFSFFTTKFIFPKIIFSQGLNDISKQNFNLNQHANIWSLQIALTHKFVKKSNEKKSNHK
ncbi:MAG TPA: hypothetical protein VFG10_17440 [Saprospiraceae bacterium]|nr:hypothetical protein [Saprospiraceae bacterium]